MNVISKLNTAASAILLAVALFSSCTSSSDYTYGVWKQRADFDGKARVGAASFVINGYGYLSGGYYGKTERLIDTWKYDIANDTWTQVADFKGEGTAYAAGFSASGKGYITTGQGYDINTTKTTYLKDTWQYDPDADSWTQVADFPGTARQGALSFSFSDEGYVGCGWDDYYEKDIYAYNPSNNTWSNAEFTGTKRTGGTGFVISDSVAYVGLGVNSSGYNYDFLKYNRKTKVWTRMRETANRSTDDYDDDYGTLPRAFATSCVIKGVAYIIAGTNGSPKSDYWEYIPETDLWNQGSFTPLTKHSKATSRQQAVGFSTGERGFVVTGGSGGGTFYDNTLELIPHTHDEDDN